MHKALKNTFEELNSDVSFQKSELVASISMQRVVSVYLWQYWCKESVF